MLHGQVAHKLLIRVRLRASELVIKMNNGEHDPKFRPQVKQNAQQANRIRATGDGNADALACPQQIMLAEVFQNRVGKPVHGNILYAAHLKGRRRGPAIASVRAAEARKTESAQSRQ
jgi:hypothetical protein